MSKRVNKKDELKDLFLWLQIILGVCVIFITFAFLGESAYRHLLEGSFALLLCLVAFNNAMYLKVKGISIASLILAILVLLIGVFA